MSRSPPERAFLSRRQSTCAVKRAVDCPPRSGRSRPDEIRSLLSTAMSSVYCAEVPQYGDLIQLVSEINASALADGPELEQAMLRTREPDRLELERHGAVRIRRVFAVLGMHPVGYYDLSVAGVPVHATAFRPVEDSALQANPFRVFTSLLRLEVIEDEALRKEAVRVLSGRQIFTLRTLDLVRVLETEGSLGESEAEEFVREVLETFRWHSDATVTMATYAMLHQAHRLIADVVSFHGPVHSISMPSRPGCRSGASAQRWLLRGRPVAGARSCFARPALKRLRSASNSGRNAAPPSRALILPASARFSSAAQHSQRAANFTIPVGFSPPRNAVDARGSLAGDYATELAERKDFPDSWTELRDQELAYFRYSPTPAVAREKIVPPFDLLVGRGYLRFDPIIYEEFLPVSAAAIFQSNLGTGEQQNYAGAIEPQGLRESLGCEGHQRRRSLRQDAAGLDRACIGSVEKAAGRIS